MTITQRTSLFNKMTTIQEIYFSDETYSAKEMLNILFKKKKVKKIDIINIIKEW